MRGGEGGESGDLGWGRGVGWSIGGLVAGSFRYGGRGRGGKLEM